MATDFFTQQEQAKKRTFLLVALFVVAVILLIGLTAFLALLFFGEPNLNQSNLDILFLSTAVVLGGVTGAMLFKFHQLKAGGRYIAERLGGTLLNPNSTNPTERRVLNVVEEMALAANMPVPPVYLLKNEPGINAFAAGYSPQDAVIGITQGSVDQFTREELQGVIAHEFSHILNGDMRLNIRIMAILHGILCISYVGEILMRSGARSRSRNDKNMAPLIGLGLWILGLTGVFFGSIIKAAVSRQREFLADASAVQFTRSPHSIGDALQRIAASQEKGVVHNKNASEASHLFFNQAVGGISGFLFATHPPIDQRIKRVLPQWDGQYRVRIKPTEQTSKKSNISDKQKTVLGAVAGAAVLSSASSSTTDNLGATALFNSIKEQARDTQTVLPVILALTLDQKASGHLAQHALIEKEYGEPLLQHVKQAYAGIAHLSIAERLPLVELSMPALKMLALEEKQQLLRILQLLIEADQQTTLFEWCLLQLVKSYVDTDLHPNKKVPKVRLFAKSDTEFTLSVLAWYGVQEEADAKHAFDLAARHLGTRLTPFSQPFNFSRLSDAIERIRQWSVSDQQRLIIAWTACVQADGVITPIEQQLLFTLASSIGQPLAELPMVKD